MFTPLQFEDVKASGRTDLINWAHVLWRRKFLGLIILIGVVSLAIIYLNIATYRYLAVLTVTPADQNASKSGGGLASIGSLVGVDLNSQGSSAFGIYSEAVTSYPVAEQLGRDEPLMRAIFSQSWDARQLRWHEPHSALHSLSEAAKHVLGVPTNPWQPPSARELQAYLDKNLIVTEDKKKPFIQLSYMNEDPQLAVRLLRETNAATDDFLRQRSLKRASIYVDYLEQRLAQIQVADYRLSILQALSTYEKTRMMASVNASFAAETFGDIFVSPAPTSPNPWLILLVAVVVAVAAWVGLVLIILPTFKGKQRGSNDSAGS